MSSEASRRLSLPRQAVEDYARTAYRRAILEAAERLFARAGYHQTKMADLAAEAGVAVGTLYRYFKNKEEVFASLFTRHRAEMFAIVDEVEAVPDPLARLERLVAGVMAYVEKRGAFFAIYAELGAVLEAQVRALEGSAPEQDCDRFMRAVESALQDAVRAGTVRGDLPISLLATALTGAVHSALVAWVRAGRGHPLTPQGKPLIDLFLQGARPQ